MATADFYLKHLLSTSILRLIRVYQYLLSPWIGHQCRFHPSCSVYATEAIKGHGIVKGAYLSCRRMLRCHPWHPGGIDLVPLKK